MARPETVEDVTTRQEQFATFQTDKISTMPALLKHYVALLEANEKLGGTTETGYNTVTLYRPKTKSELESQLRMDQNAWDSYQKLYFRAVKADAEDEPLREYEKDRVKEWAKAEGKPDPFDVFAANDPELAEIRKSLGMNE